MEQRSSFSYYEQRVDIRYDINVAVYAKSDQIEMHRLMYQPVNLVLVAATMLDLPNP
ncbi:MAG: hypothetical protein AAFY41_19360 [Bacteroidota bacterium]